MTVSYFVNDSNKNQKKQREGEAVRGAPSGTDIFSLEIFNFYFIFRNGKWKSEVEYTFNLENKSFINIILLNEDLIVSQFKF